MRVAFKLSMLRTLLMSLAITFRPSNALCVSFTPYGLIRASRPDTIDYLLSQFQATPTTISNVDRLLRYQKYNFGLHYLAERAWPDVKQEAMLPFIKIAAYHETIFQPMIILCNLRLMEAIFSSDDTDSLIYNGTLLRELDLRFLDWQRPGFEHVICRALKNAIRFDWQRAESWGILEHFIVLSGLSIHLFEYLTLYHQMLPVVLALYLTLSLRPDDLLDNIYFYNGTSDESEMRVRAIVFTASLSCMVVDDPGKVSAIKRHVHGYGRSRPQIAKLVQGASRLTIASIAEMATNVPPNLKVLLWNSVAHLYQEASRSLSYQSTVEAMSNLLRVDSDFLDMTPLTLVERVLTLYHRSCWEHLRANPQDHCMTLLQQLPDRYKPVQLKSFDERLKLWNTVGPFNMMVALSQNRSATFVELRDSILIGSNQYLETIAGRVVEGMESIVSGTKYLTMLNAIIISWVFCIVESETRNMEFMFPEMETEHEEPSWRDVFNHWENLGFMVEGGQIRVDDQIYRCFDSCGFYLFSPNEVRGLVDSSFQISHQDEALVDF